MLAWAGKILKVNLTNQELQEETYPIELGKKYLGARGVNAKLLWDQIKEPNIDPLSPENPLIIGTGTLTGTSAPCNGRTTITCKSPATNLYLKTNMWGHWGAELKFAGYDHLIITGASDKPVYLLIKDNEIDVKDAQNYGALMSGKPQRGLKESMMIWT